LDRDSLKFAQTADSHAAQSHDAWDPDWTAYKFSALLKCDNPACKECVAVVGKGGLREEISEDGSELIYPASFYPHTVTPALKFVPIPTGCPEPIVNQLLSSFEVMWGSPAAAATHVRIAVECLLDALRVPRAERIKGKYTRRRNLHERITIIEADNRDLAEALKAIKWVGNEAAHLGELDRDALFDAYDILENVLDELYVKNKANTHKLIRDINKRKGPRKTSRKKE
jgi:hypothetical protein